MTTPVHTRQPKTDNKAQTKEMDFIKLEPFTKTKQQNKEDRSISAIMAGGRQQEEETRDKGRQALVCIPATRSHLLLLTYSARNSSGGKVSVPGIQSPLSSVNSWRRLSYTSPSFFPVA